MPDYVFVEYRADGEEIEHRLPARFEVCPTCEGCGQHSLRFGAISAEEFMGPDWDDESRDDYLSGRYDERCETCKGKRVVAVLNRSAVSADILAKIDQRAEEDAEYEAMCAAERRYGA